MHHAYRIIILLFIFYIQPVSAKTEREIIFTLLNYLEKSDLLFFKNSIPYSAREARTDMEEKLVRSGTTITTAEDFIHKLASKSYQTGQVYYVKLADGRKMTLEEWFTEQLQKIRSKKNRKR